ncbi:uncharacterized protein TRAVEDRAFT_128349, partial [Trametes versicolor FP-101664 SS1]|uniref:uncharacterized protein n=1 Tax=Trametes versicolor (strain FP-101664) TaxID=717944 RepID=UPI0004623862
MQARSPGGGSHPRKLSLWNGFVSVEMQKFNADRNRGDRNRVSSQFIKELSARWQAMSPEEQEDAGAGALQALEERRVNRDEGIHNVALHSLHDVRTTTSKIRRDIENLNKRTGTEIIILGMRTDPNSIAPPFVFYTNERIREYIELVTNSSMQDFTMRLEGYCISGVDSLKKNRVEEFLTLKHKVSTLILQKLQAACTRANVTKMFYVNFHQHITLRFGVVLERWPLTTFKAPGSMSSRQELLIILHAFENDVATFRQLTNPEWEGW